MTMVDQAERRIVAVFGAGGDANVAGVLSSLVSERSSFVTGLFLEDRALFRLAELPFTMEVCRVTTKRRPLTTHELECEMRVLAMRAEQSVQRVAEQAGSSWTFRRLRGRLHAALEEALEGDLLLIGNTRGALAAAGERRLRTRSGEMETRGPVAFLLDRPDASDRALDAAVDLAARTRRSLVAFVPGEADPSDAFRRIELSGRVSRTIRGVPDQPDEALLSQVRRVEPMVLVVAAGTPGFEEARIGSLRAQIRCPMVIVR